MITRIVRMSFQPEKVNDFLRLFNSTRHRIAAYEGCIELKLLQPSDDATIFYTLSRWVNEAALENYRKSELFLWTWSQTKILFQDKPEVVSLIEVE